MTWMTTFNLFYSENKNVLQLYLWSELENKIIVLVPEKESVLSRVFQESRNRTQFIFHSVLSDYGM